MFNRKSSLLAFAFFINQCVNAQSNATVATAEKTGFMRSEAKIYVVMIVVITILAGLILYLFRLDRKLTKLEKGSSL
jgi:hypothetical protein